jgi:hypothetical protein
MVNLKNAIEKFKTAGEVLGQNGPFGNGSMGCHHALTQIQNQTLAVTAPHAAPTLAL